MIVVMTQMIYCSNSVNEENTYTGLTASPESESGQKAQLATALML